MYRFRSYIATHCKIICNVISIVALYNFVASDCINVNTTNLNFRIMQSYIHKMTYVASTLLQVKYRHAWIHAL